MLGRMAKGAILTTGVLLMFVTLPLLGQGIERNEYTGLDKYPTQGRPDASSMVGVRAAEFLEIPVGARGIGMGSAYTAVADDISAIEVTLCVNDEEVIPKESKTLLKSGKLSVKPMAKTKFYELYQDYVCGCVLRLARELFALLPYEMAIVTAESEILNTQTGHLEMQPILSVAIPRRTLEVLNFETLDPSDSMNNFVHRMNFMKTKGFRAVDAVSPSELGA